MLFFIFSIISLVISSFHFCFNLYLMYDVFVFSLVIIGTKKRPSNHKSRTLHNDSRFSPQDTYQYVRFSVDSHDKLYRNYNIY